MENTRSVCWICITNSLLLLDRSIYHCMTVKDRKTLNSGFYLVLDPDAHKESKQCLGWLAGEEIIGMLWSVELEPSRALALWLLLGIVTCKACRQKWKVNSVKAAVLVWSKPKQGTIYSRCCSNLRNPNIKSLRTLFSDSNCWQIFFFNFRLVYISCNYFKLKINSIFHLFRGSYFKEFHIKVCTVWRRTIFHKLQISI